MSRSASHVASGANASARSVEGVRVLVVGLGRFGGGVGVTRWLVSEGAVVTVTDSAPEATLSESLRAIADLDVTLHLGGHDLTDLDATDLAVVNPAVDKSRSELFREIVRREVPWTTETNLFCERCFGRIIGVTGSYGKSTTCAMLAEVLQAAGRGKTYLGGNIGRSLLPELGEISPSDDVVLEMSDVQLADLPRIGWAPPVAVITNLFPHHLDRYAGFGAYIDAKLNILRNGGGDGFVVIGDVHPEAEDMLQELASGREEGFCRVCIPDAPVSLRIPGRHNQANAACVLTVCRCLGLDEDMVRKALAAFEGLPHRLQHVRTLDGVDYINDSKSTAPDAILAAVDSLEQSPGRASMIVAIVGGQRKDVALRACADVLASKCRAVICVGESGPVFAKEVRSTVAGGGACGLDGAECGAIVREASDLAEAVRLARVSAQAGDAVLFSPGAPSFDAYVNYTARGRHFVELVEAF